MEQIKFYTKEYVHQEIKNLCLNKCICSNGTIFYTFKFGKGTVYAVDNTLKNLKYSYILELYKIDLERLKMINSIISNIPEIEICFDKWDLVDDVHIGSFENENLEIEVGQFLLTIDLKVSEKSKESGGYSSDDPLEIDKLGCKICINDIKIENEEGEELELEDTEFEKLRTSIINNILI